MKTELKTNCLYTIYYIGEGWRRGDTQLLLLYSNENKLCNAIAIQPWWNWASAPGMPFVCVWTCVCVHMSADVFHAETQGHSKTRDTLLYSCERRKHLPRIFSIKVRSCFSCTSSINRNMAHMKKNGCIGWSDFIRSRLFL